jgi:hypothetical protein
MLGSDLACVVLVTSAHHSTLDTDFPSIGLAVSGVNRSSRLGLFTPCSAYSALVNAGGTTFGLSGSWVQVPVVRLGSWTIAQMVRARDYRVSSIFVTSTLRCNRASYRNSWPCSFVDGCFAPETLLFIHSTEGLVLLDARPSVFALYAPVQHKRQHMCHAGTTVSSVKHSVSG